MAIVGRIETKEQLVVEVAIKSEVAHMQNIMFFAKQN
jgi:hypothetical protein